MQTRIRELRKRRSLTLQQLADLIGTTPQTVQRLETANMTVSMEWLSRFADAFGVRASDLIADDPNRNIPLLGRIGRDGTMQARSGDHVNDAVALDVPADDPVAVQLESDVGDYPAGSFLIGNRLSGADIVNAHGHDCIVMLASGLVLLRRLICRDGLISIVPIEPSGDVRFDVDIAWAARLILQLRYL
ncbi:MAG: helix-turn-helix transcriptional regulator [Hyphomicrobiales bacterium]|nr:helix-turn-helix transcriptional regulator [Hyphomicrobiales bacterium]